MLGHQQESNLLSDYCDGHVYRSHPLFSDDKSALQLMIYYDNVEVCNPLGSRAKTHKLGKVDILVQRLYIHIQFIFLTHMQLYFITRWETFLQGIDLHYKQFSFGCG